ncbi:AraC family transcriptional regulator [Paraburkholderia sacchari]|uniref:AraC family transcriptional regulator n=1 Tax=Paraburkholderia sacchari TaxID=159450 RepID=UPI0039A54D46
MTSSPHWASYRWISSADDLLRLDPVERTEAEWFGLPMVIQQLPGSAEVANLTVSPPSLAIARSGSGQRDYRFGARQRKLYSAPGMFELYGTDFYIDHAKWEGRSGQIVSIQFPLTQVNRLLHAGGTGFNLPTRFELFDTNLTELTLRLWQEAHHGNPNGRMFAEGLSLALLGLLIEHHGAYRSTSTRSPTELSSSNRALVRDYIEQHLASELSIETLAGLAGMSPHHFARAFKATFEMPPHAYVTECRIELAKSLLKFEQERSLADIAGGLGFSSQSHFTEVFRRRVGTTPGRWRRAG